MVEPRMNGEQQAHTDSERHSLPAECLDDRPPAGETTVKESRLGQVVRAESQAADPGGALRAAREARNLSVEDIARTTKIGMSTLTALERNEVEKLPAAIFTRGFLKAYAKEVGLDPDETADLYLAHLLPETLAVDGATARLMVATPAERTEVFAYDDDTTKFLAVRQAGRFGWLFTAVAVIGLAVYIWSFTWDRPSTTETSVPTQAPPTDASPASGTPQTTTDAAPAALSAIETPVGPLQFELKPSGPCWLAAAADGNPVFARLMQPGEQQTIEVNEELILRVGDPAALSFSINGRQGRVLGRAGEPIDVRITRDNFRDFLSS